MNKASVPWVLVMALSLPACGGQEINDAPEGGSGTVTAGLLSPFELVAAPDGQLWVTERTAGRVTRVSPKDGSKTTLLTLDDVLITKGTQDGLLGMALSPGFLEDFGTDYVFLAYTYDADVRPDVIERRVKIVRYTYDADASTLTSPVQLLAGLPGSDGHNAGRLAIGPDRKLYYTIGDQANNERGRACKPIRAQELPTTVQVTSSDWTAYEGKVLRMNLDGSIPADNPVIGGTRSHVYARGLRDPEGLAIGPDGTVYVADRGPKTDDEIDVIEPGRSYGWPNVAGYKDDQAYVYGNWSGSVNPPCEKLKYSDYAIPKSVPKQKESSFNLPDFRPPAVTLYTVPGSFWFQDPTCGDLQDLCWPTIAPSGIVVYNEYPKGIGPARATLLVTSLKQGALFRVRLGAGGPPAIDVLFRTVNRYRDVAVAPDGRTVYVITDSTGTTLGPDGPTGALQSPGAILSFRLPD